jgi:hypothetical protein
MILLGLLRCNKGHPEDDAWYQLGSRIGLFGHAADRSVSTCGPTFTVPDGPTLASHDDLIIDSRWEEI